MSDPCTDFHRPDALAPGRWSNRFAALPEAFHTRQPSTPLPAPYWVACNARLAAELGLDPAWLDSPEALGVFSGNQVLPGMAPLASVYSGHQFGVWAGQLGDGRAILIGETHGGHEWQLKGSGRTPYSRMGDGRAVLRSSIREFLGSEALHGLGIPTTRALALTGSDAPVMRETIETAAVVTRLAPSFIRFGHFEHFAAQDDQEALQLLADRVIAWHYPECLTHPAGDGRRYAAFLEAIGGRTARLLAHWQAVGFCHGVMNTDNMSILGLTLDYGPFQFLDAFQPGHICNHSDSQGRYAFDRQPQVAYWNLYCLARTLLPLIGDPELAQASLEPYKSLFARDFESLMLEKLGWTGPQTNPDAGRQLVEDTLAMMARQQVDHTLFWRRLSRAVASQDMEPVRDLMPDRPLFDDWLQRYHQHGKACGRAPDAALMLQRNPKYVLRNHLAEIAIQKARAKDFSEVRTLLHLLETPFEEHPGFESYADLPPDWAASIEISCSS